MNERMNERMNEFGEDKKVERMKKGVRISRFALLQGLRDRQTDQQMDLTSYRCARKRVKIESALAQSETDLTLDDYTLFVIVFYPPIKRLFFNLFNSYIVWNNFIMLVVWWSQSVR